MDALTFLAQDHKAVGQLFKKFEATRDDDLDRRRKLVDQMVVELSKHAAIEEAIFYPAVREAIPEEESQVLESLEEHHLVKWTLDELSGLPADAERFDAKVFVLMENVRHHIEEEEQEMFPAVRKAMGQARLRALGEKLARARKVAPTRPHPRSPDSPPGNLVTTPLAAALDRSRDLIKRVSPRKASQKVRKTLGAVASRKTRAQRIEREDRSRE